MINLDHRKHLSSLDGWRGIAVLAVAFYHLYPGSAKDPVVALAAYGWLGVDLFFVLSGFLITGILFETSQQEGFFKNFYARRALRLFPLYFAIVFVILAINAHLGGTLTRWAFPYFVYGSNVVDDLQLPTGFLFTRINATHLWSLALEEQFYLVWPVAVLLARTRNRVLALCLSLGLVALILRWVSTVTPHFFLGTPYFELPMRMDSLLAGGALALLLRSPRGEAILTRARLTAALLVSAGVFLWSCWGQPRPAMHAVSVVRYGYTASAIGFTALLGLALAPGSWANRLGDVAALRKLGRYSYGFYLLHLLPSAQLRHVSTLVKDHITGAHGSSSFIGHLAQVAVLLVYLGLVFLVAMASYHLMELPILKLKRYFSYSDEQRADRLQVDQQVAEPARM